MNYYISKEECLAKGEEWLVYHFNFQNIFNALLTLFVIAGLDGWSEHF